MSRIKNMQPTNQELFVSYADANGLQKANKAAFNHEAIRRSKGSSIYRGVEPGITVREGMNRSDYNAFRPEEATPTEIKNIIRASMWAYKRVPLVRNVVDLMSDFGCQGIHIVHGNQNTQDFLRKWAKKVHFKERCERFLNILYRTGNVVVKRVLAKLRQQDFDNIHKGIAAEADILKVNPPSKIPKNQIPWSYTFNSPLSIEIVGGDDLALFAGKVQYALRIPANVANRIKNPRNAEELLIIQNIPDYIIQAAKAGKTLVPLDPDKIRVFHYKKDDWEGWAEPMTSSILDDLTTLNKLKLADLAALDGAISHIRLWRLGSLEHKIYPTDAAIAKLSDMLSNSVGGGPVDIIWGPELDLVETKSDIYRFLGSEKYTATLISIYDGLGIPIILTGYAGKGATNNQYLSVKTIIERLKYGRERLADFWLPEINEVMQAIGAKGEAQLVFDRMLLTDEAAEKALLIQMADRNLISDTSLQERFGEIPELELLRQKREQKQRDRGTRSRKASQWHNPEHEESLKKIALQNGIVSPSQVGLELEDAKPGEVPAIEHKVKSQEATKKQAGESGEGRPLNSKDSKKRKKKTSKSITSAFVWARSAQEEISKIVNKWYLEAANKKNMRQLSDEETVNLDNLKYSVLCNMAVYSAIDEEAVSQLLCRIEPLAIPNQVSILCKETTENIANKFNRNPSIEEIRQIQASVYALFRGEI